MRIAKVSNLSSNVNNGHTASNVNFGIHFKKPNCTKKMKKTIFRRLLKEGKFKEIIHNLVSLPSDFIYKDGHKRYYFPD